MQKKAGFILRLVYGQGDQRRKNDNKSCQRNDWQSTILKIFIDSRSGEVVNQKPPSLTRSFLHCTSQDGSLVNSGIGNHFQIVWSSSSVISISSRIREKTSRLISSWTLQNRFAFGIIKCFSKIFEVLAIGFWFPWLELNCLILFFLLSFVWKFGKTRSWDLINILWNFCLKIFPELLTFSKPLYSKNLKGKPYATKQMFVRYFHLSVCISCRSAKCQNILENYQTHWLNVDLPDHQIMIATAVIIIVLLQKACTNMDYTILVFKGA